MICLMQLWLSGLQVWDFFFNALLTLLYVLFFLTHFRDLNVFK